MEKFPILLVEDQPDDQFLTLRALRKCRIRNVTVANEGEEALRYLRESSGASGVARGELPELIILDIRMPKVDGFEFLESIRGDHRVKHIPVVVLTSSPQEKDRARCRELGVKAYLNKPLEVGTFESVLSKIASS
jgi:CheY-like chemotaxis protein